MRGSVQGRVGGGVKVDESCAVDVLLRGTTRTSVQPRSNQVPARTRRERQGQSCDHLDMPPSKPPRYPWPDMAVERSIKRANRSRGRRLGPLSAPRAYVHLVHCRTQHRLTSSAVWKRASKNWNKYRESSRECRLLVVTAVENGTLNQYTVIANWTRLFRLLFVLFEHSTRTT